MDAELVSVIVPAYNAAATLAQSLRSARAQSYDTLEIIVVDDGSTDGTLEIARSHASQDPRIRVFSQAHAGPSRARNSAIAAARGDLIAPLDADDLWRGTKVERQVEALRAGGERVGLVYTWFALIDAKGRIRSTAHRPTQTGAVLRACCRRNLVGNGSGALMRRSAIVECGGYDEALSACEDLKLYTAIAEHYEYALVPEHLTGYRQTNANLTSDVGMMRRSADAVLAALAIRHPAYEGELGALKCDLYHWLLRRGLMAHRMAESIQIACALWRLDPAFALRSFAGLPVDLLVRVPLPDRETGLTGYFLEEHVTS